MTLPGLLENLTWRFGGPLASLSPVIAWSILIAAGTAGLVWVIASYQRTLVDLPRWKRRTLLSLRLLLLVLMIVLLAGPARVERPDAPGDDTQAPRPLALLIDHSESMHLPDNRRQRRIDDAQRRWLSFAPSAEKGFCDIKTFAFAKTFSALADTAAQPELDRGQTHLFSALQRLLREAPPGGWGGIVTLTDGLDTSGSSVTDAVDATVASATGTKTPLYFVPGRNRYAGASFLQLRDWTLPSRMAPRSSFRLEVTIDSYQSEALSLPINLRVGEIWRPTEMLHIEAGRRMKLWTAEINAGEVGTLPIELRIGSAPQSVTARADIQVQAPSSTRILYYQGALDWGYKFFADILRRDPAFTLTPIFRLAPARAASNAHATTVGPPLPIDHAGYADYDIVVLANASASQLSGEQQAALTAWVRAGGVLVFLAPDDAATQGFADSELEKMLPVVFASDAPAPRDAFNIRERMRAIGRSGGGTDTQATALSEFSWEPGAKKIFGEGEITSPRFINYAHVLRAKPGAEILARHPTDPSPKDGDAGRAILLAVQRYGQGQSAVLTSDALWRWKLNQPSSERNVEKFWQNLFAWLGRERASDLRFDRAPLTVRSGQEIPLRLLGAGATTASVVATSGPASFPLQPGVRETETAQLFRWTPASAGEWKLTATDATGHATHHWLHVVASVLQGEASGAPPDEALLAQLAQRTGGAVLNENEAAAWTRPHVETGLPAPPEIVRPLWHHLWIFAVLLGSYACELVLRRWWRLL